MALIVFWFVFHCHGNEIKISSSIVDMEGERMSFRSFSILKHIIGQHGLLYVGA
jgi:hypothetical protein